jgi:hypothetical protein
MRIKRRRRGKASAQASQCHFLRFPEGVSLCLGQHDTWVMPLLAVPGGGAGRQADKAGRRVQPARPQLISKRQEERASQRKKQVVSGSSDG